MPQTIYAVIIGINDYPHNPLYGCINDALEVREFFRKIANSNQDIEKFDAKLLLSPRGSDDAKALKEAKLKKKEYEAPTRKNIIKAFDHFNKADAEKGDICLFYYSGHGSIQTAPPEFWHMKSGKQLETIVCSDSRKKGGHDLLDKELAYLIWNATKGKEPGENGKKGVHFLAIMDCCHAGDNTRGMEATIKVREANPNSTVSTFENYLGFQKKEASIDSEDRFYEFTTPERVDIQYARHVQFAAARESESAKEMQLDNKRRGVFTYCLLKALRNGGVQFSYKELQRRVEMMIQNRVDAQIPLLYAKAAEDENLSFLGTHLKTPIEEYVVSFRTRDDVNEWIMDGGSINGITPSSDQAGETVVQVIDPEAPEGQQKIHSARVIEVRPAESVLDPEAFSEEEKAREDLKATILKMARPQIDISYAEDLDPELKTKLSETYKPERARYYSIISEKDKAKYLVKNIRDAYILTKQGSDIPIFKRNTSPEAFLNQVDSVGKWWSVMEMNNPVTSISRDEIQVEVSVIEGKIFTSGKKRLRSYEPLERLTPTREVMVNPEEVTVEHIEVEEDWTQPAIRVNIKLSSQNYFVSTLYLGSLFGISCLLKTTEIAADGTGEWLKFKAGNKEYISIPLGLDTKYHDFGITEITGYLKIFVATTHFDVSGFEQEGLQLDDALRSKGNRNLGLLSSPEESFEDWMCVTLPIKIKHPLSRAANRTEIDGDGNGSAVIAGAKIMAPKGFKATFAAASSAHVKEKIEGLQRDKSVAKKALKELNDNLLPPASIWGSVPSSSTVFNRGLVTSSKDTQLSILELEGISGHSAVSEDHPITFIPEGGLTEDEVILPFGYDTKTGMYYPLGISDEHGGVNINQLPQPTPGQIFAEGSINKKSVGSSVKIFLKKIFWSPLTGKKDYNKLTVCSRTEDGRVLAEPVKEGTLSEPSVKNIAILIHGILGDSEDKKRGFFIETDLYKDYDKVLAFDYENLNTPIKGTAQDLKERLQEAGLFEVAEKRLTIIAHSMGGLVSRWFIEKEGGSAVVKRLIQLGTPNGGSEISDFRKSIFGMLTMGMNGLAILKPYLPMLAWVGKKVGKAVFKTLDQMSPKNVDFLPLLNDGTKVSIPYDIIGGNTSKILAEPDETDPFWRQWVKMVKDRGAYVLADQLIFAEDNDMAVTLTSMKAIPEFDESRFHEIACNHMSYFIDKQGGLESLTELIREGA